MHKRYKIKEEMVTNAGGVGEYSTPKAFKKYRIKEIKVNKPPQLTFPYKINNEEEWEKFKKLATEEKGWSSVMFGKNINPPFYVILNNNSYGIYPVYKKTNESSLGNLLHKIKSLNPEQQAELRVFLKEKFKISEVKDLFESHEPKPTDFPIKISSYEQAQIIGHWLQKNNYNLNLNQPPFNTKPLINPFYIKADGKDIHFDLLNEIKVNNPLEPYPVGSLVTLKDGVDDVLQPRIFKVMEYIDNRIYLESNGFRIWVKNGDLIPYKKEINESKITCSCGWSWDLADGGSDPYTCHKCGKINTLQESKYSQFKQSTPKPNPKQILHKAIKEIQLKLDEVNKLIDFTSRIKGELTEGDQEIEYLKRTKDNINKIQNRLKEVFNKLCELDEIKVNKPTKIIDFLNTPYSTWKDIKVGDKIKLPNGNIEEIEDLYLPKVRTKNGEYNLIRLYNQNQANILSEIKVNKPKRIWDFTKYIPNFNPKNIKIGDKIKTKRYVLVIDNIQDEGGNLQFYSPQGMDDEETLNQINNKNHTKTLSEIKVNNPLISFDDLMKQGLYGNANRTIAVFKQMGFNMNDYGKGLEGFFKELSQEDKIKMIGIAKKMNK